MAVSEGVKTLVNSKIISIPNRELYKHTRYLILARRPTLIHLLSSANKKTTITEILRSTGPFFQIFFPFPIFQLLTLLPLFPLFQLFQLFLLFQLLLLSCPWRSRDVAEFEEGALPPQEVALVSDAHHQKWQH